MSKSIVIHTAPELMHIERISEVYQHNQPQPLDISFGALGTAMVQIIVHPNHSNGAGMAQWLCNGLPRNDPGFDSQWGWCKNRASSPS